MMSEPGSPQDITMSSGDEDMADDAPTFSQSPEDMHPSSSAGKLPTSPWFARMQRTNRVPTPIQPPERPGIRPMQVHTGVRHHIRQRHPQENISLSSDLLEVPSPIDEDEVPTPPSAAEAAGSQLSMLTVNDMDMEPSDTLLPSISIDTSEAFPLDEQGGHGLEMESAVDVEHMDDGDLRESRLTVRKQRQRSGALSSGQGSPSPARAVPDLAVAKRGFSMGFRADCEKCRMRVPGHMNHFVS